ncbi:hypothetical protein [Salinigranum halophilum]|uniref:hypothetical protein n=1 Tax=Salinigranum halophilum TaxID=2565931 RepID=UPI00115DEA7F|nr:hypothetical protein [Salinigranum halophilum]
MEIANQAVEKELTIDDSKPFVTKQDVAAADSETPAYEIKGPRGYVVGIPVGANFAPEFRDSAGAPIDPSARVTLQKCDRQGNRLGGKIAITDLLSSFDYEQMRTDPDYFRKVTKPLMIDEDELVRCFIDIPAGSNGFSASESRLTIGDDTSDFGVPAEIVSHSDLTTEESKAVKRASTRGGR